MSQWRLRTRFMLAYAGLILLGFTGLALLAGQQISQGAAEDYDRGLETQVSLVANALREKVEHFAEGELSQADLLTAINNYAQQLNARISLVDGTGRMWLDSSGALAAKSQTTNPEIVSALQGRVVSDLRQNEAGEWTVYVAAPIVEHRTVLSLVQLSVPHRLAQEMVIQRWLGLGAWVVVLAFLAVGASLLLSSSLIRPLDQLRRTALDMAGGNLSQRLPTDRADEIGELAVAFNHMAEQVQAMLEEQRAFASNASHELRTPLTTIRLRSEALREGLVDEATAKQYIIDIDDEMIRLSHLVTDLIVLSRFDSGRAERGQEEVDVLRLAQGLQREFLPQALARQITLVLNTPAELPFIQASWSHMQVVWRNLLDNALKYSLEGGHVVWSLAQEGDFLLLTVQDDGQGVEAGDLAHLTERFYRADKARTREVPGVGLGLALVDSVVRFYNGRFIIESPGLGQGTTVRVWWPVTERGRDES